QTRDVCAVLAYVRPPAPPVWLIGTRRGSMTVANAAARLSGGERPYGIVVTSGALMSSRSDSQSAQSTARGLNRIAVPTLLVGHELDQCRFSPASDENRKSTRLNSSHVSISYAVFCLKKKKN